jgi:membrane associated rhomboid family serine protease
MSETPPLYSAVPTSLEWRDAVIRKLLELSRPGRASSAALSEIDNAGAAVFLITLGRLAVFLAWPPDDAFGGVRVNQRIEAIRASVRPGTQVDLIIVGGGQAGRHLCEDLAETQAKGGRITFHHLLDDGRLWSPRKTVPPVIDVALREVRADLGRGAHLSALSQAEIIVAREAFNQLATGEQAAIRLLTSRRVPATIGLLAVLVAVFLLEILWSNSAIITGKAGAASTLFKMGAADGAALRSGEWWRLFTPAFLHGGLLHIAVNGWSLWVLGGMIERLFGSARFLVIYGASTVVAATASSFFGQGLSVGASGALFGLLGAQVALALYPRGVLPVSLASRIRRGLWGPLVINISISTLPGIDWHAHLGGAIAGFFFVMSGLPSLGLPPLEVRAVNGARSRPWSIAAAFVVVAIAAALGAAFGHGRPWDSGVGPIVRVTLPGTHISLAVPKALELTRHDHNSEHDDYVFGNPGRSEIVVEVLVAPDPTLDGAPKERIEEEMLAHAQAIKEEGMKITQAAKVVETPEGPVASLVGSLNDWQIATWLTVRGTNWIRVDVNHDAEAAPAWKELAPTFAASVREER